MPTAQIFISYRRDDSAGYARAVHEALVRQFGAERVFIDVEDIGAGLPFDEVILHAVHGSALLLVLIGRRWLGERDGLPARITEPGDFVRQEVAAALARGLRVIPLLVDGASMPLQSQLPASLQALARHQALVIEHSRFAADIDRLVATLRAALGPSPGAPAAAAVPAPAAPGRVARRVALRWGGLALLALVLLVVAAGLLASRGWWAGPDGVAGADAAAGAGAPAASAAAAPAVRPAVNGRWQAQVVYDWPNARYTERFEFTGQAGELLGSASFLGVGRGIVEGSAAADGLRFVTRTREIVGSDGAGLDVRHRYSGRLVGDALHLVMQTEGGSSVHAALYIVAQRVAP